MNDQIKIGLLLISIATTMIAGLYVSFVPLTVTNLIAAVLTGLVAYIYIQKGDFVASIGSFAVSGAFLTIVLSSITPLPFYPVKALLCGIGLFIVIFQFRKIYNNM